MDDDTSENSKLRQEIAYLTSLISSHKTTGANVNRPSNSNYQRSANVKQYNARPSSWSKYKMENPVHKQNLQWNKSEQSANVQDTKLKTHLTKTSTSVCVKPVSKSRTVLLPSSAFTDKQTISTFAVASDVASKQPIHNKQTVRESVESEATVNKGASKQFKKVNAYTTKYQKSNSNQGYTSGESSDGGKEIDKPTVKLTVNTQFKKVNVDQIRYKKTSADRTNIVIKGTSSEPKAKGPIVKSVLSTSTPLRTIPKKTDISVNLADLSTIVVDDSSWTDLSSPPVSGDSPRQASSILSNLSQETKPSSPCKISKYKLVRSSQDEKPSTSSKPVSEKSMLEIVHKALGHHGGTHKKNKRIVNRFKFVRGQNNSGVHSPELSVTSPKVKRLVRLPGSEAKLKFHSKYKLTRKHGASVSDKDTSRDSSSPDWKPRLKNKYKFTKDNVASTSRMVSNSIGREKPQFKSKYKLTRNQGASSPNTDLKLSSSIVNKYKVVRRRSSESHVNIGKYKLLKTHAKDPSRSVRNGSMSWRRGNKSVKRKVLKPLNSRYKIVKPSPNSPRPHKVLPSRSKLKLDRRTKPSTSRYSLSRSRRPSSNRLVMINGIVFNSSKNKLRRNSLQRKTPTVFRGKADKSTKTISVGGVKYRTDRSGKTLKRISDSVTSLSTYRSPSSSRLSSYQNTWSLASRALYRSRRIAATKLSKKKERDYCLFYNRYGKCNRGDKCQFIHDPTRIAVCTRFLRGTCKVDSCPFSHNVAKEKMPVCSYFLRGVCNQDNCPYLHVNVAKDAEICKEFLKGFCKQGEMCKKKHSHICPKLSQPGGCPEGAKCKMLHPKKSERSKATKRKISDRPLLSSDKSEDAAKDKNECIIPNKQQKLSSELPSFISLHNSTLDVSQGSQPSTSQESIQIRPRFLMD